MIIDSSWNDHLKPIVISSFRTYFIIHPLMWGNIEIVKCRNMAIRKTDGICNDVRQRYSWFSLIGIVSILRIYTHDWMSNYTHKKEFLAEPIYKSSHLNNYQNWIKYLTIIYLKWQSYNTSVSMWKYQASQI